MANDSNAASGSLERDSSSHTDSFFNADDRDTVFDPVQVAQADGAAAPVAAATPGAPQQIEIPAGASVVRVAVTAGEVVVLAAPFTADAELIGRVGDGNLAIKVGDVTVILQGYVDANQQAPVTVETAGGQPIDVATMLASTDPALDIQTAAGPGDAAGAQGADNSGAIFAAFGNGAGLGGLNAVGAQDGTELSYGLIDNSIRQELAQPTLGALGTFGFSVGALSGGHSERFFRDPAQTASLGDFATFMTEYQDAVENPSAPLFPGWADFQGTGATNGDFQEYLDQTRRSVDVNASFTGATGELVLNGITPNLTSNGSLLHVEHADQGHTLFVRRDSDNALVAVIHVEGPSPDGGFTIDTFMINRLDHPDAGTGDAGRDEMTIGVDFTVYDGPAPNSEEQEGGPTSPSLEGSFAVSFADDVPLFEDVTYHNLDGAAGGGDGLPPATDSTSTGLIDEDWLKGGANDKDADGQGNAGEAGDTAGGASVSGQIDVNFGADGPSQSDNPGYEDTGKHAFVLDTTTYTEGEDFPYGDAGLKSGGQTLVVLSVGPDHLTVGIPAPEVESEGESEVDVGGGTPIFTLVLNQDTGAFTFTLLGPLDHASDLIFGDAIAAAAVADPEDTIPLDFTVTARDDDGDYVPATIHIEVNDDVPSARDDSDSIAAGTYGPETGNVITGAGTDSPGTGSDIQGADTAVVTGVAAGGLTGTVGSEIAGSYGKLTLEADGSYSYTRNAGTKGGVDDIFSYTLTDKDGDTSSATLTIHIGDAGVTIDMPVAGRDGTVVYEQGLPERNGEPAGSGEIADGDGTDNDDTSEATTGTVTITAPDGVATVQIDGNPALTAAELADLGANPVSYSDATGTLTLTGFDFGTGALTYIYTLLDNTLADPDSVSFMLKVTDIDGSNSSGTLTVAIIDDAPSANPDSDAANSGATVTGNVELNDVFGADGKSGSGVIGVAKGTDTSAPLSGGTGAAIVGDYGTLTLNADGSYSYQAKPNVSGVDHFVYTIEDGDGDPSTTTLDITVSQVAPRTDVESVTVDEAALDTTTTGDDLDHGGVTGSNPSSANETKTGQLTLEPGVTVVNGNDQTGLFGVLHVDGDGKFTYTLTTNLSSGPLNDGTNTVPDAEVFTVTIRDADGNTAIDTIKVSVIDDVPSADPDTDFVNSGATINGNVESDDSFGADGKSGSGVVGVAKGTDISSPISGGTGGAILGDYGTLTLNADGTYSYQAKINTALPAGTLIDHFVYTIADGDGDLSTTTLDITVTKVTPSGDTETVTVNEAALDTTTSGDDLTHGSVTGSNPASADESKTGQLTLAAGVTVVGGNDQAGAYGTLHVGSDGKFTYTLTSNVLSGPLNDGTNTVADADVFTVTIKDADGNTSSDTIKISVIDDVPSADPDTNAVNSGATATGNVESDDTFGADGKSGSGVVGVAKGTDTGTPVAGGTGIALIGDYGTLTLNADGTYSYHATPNVSGVDHFVYTIKDGDGDLSTTTLDITVTKVAPSTDTESVTVNEAALDTTKDVGDLAASAITGSNPGSLDETKTGTLALGAGVTVIGGNDQTGAYGTLHVGSDGKFTYTLTSNVLSGPLNDGTNTVADADVFTVTIKDADGNTSTDTIKVSIIDDVPSADPDTNAVNSGATATGNVESDDTFGADGKSGSGVVGVATGSNTASPVLGGTGAGIVTGLGTLTLNSDGTYSYQAKSNVSGVDHFVYTIKDGDGDLSTTTLDITVAKVAPRTDTESVTVNEAALDTTKDAGDLAASAITGSNPGSPDETKTGQLTLASGVTVVGGNDQTGAYGTLHVGSDGKFTYTLTSNVLSGGGNDGTNTVPDAETFSVTIKDADGNTATDTIKVSIIDDVSDADPDTGAANSGATINGNVETNDGFGADGKAGSGVVGVATGSNVGSPVSGGTGAGIVTSLGTLTLNTDGTYSYQAKPNVSGVDHFVYTIADKDGDLSTTTLDITVTKVAPTTDTESVTVNEAALDTTKDAGDLAVSAITGSIPGSPDETKTGTLALGAGVTVIGGNDQTGTYGTLHVGSDGKFTYTLTSNVLSGPLNDGTNTAADVDVFTVTIKDADGNTATDTIKVSVIDDVPTADPDTNAVNSGATATGNVESDDTFGADGKSGSGVVGVATGSNTASPVSGGTGAGIVTSLGTLTLNADGTYSYQAKPNVSGVDHFVYTIKDGDGDLSTTTLDITVTKLAPTTDTESVTVNEAALDTTKDVGDLAASAITGSNGSSPDESKTGTLTLGAGVTVVGGNDQTGLFGKLHVDADGKFTYTLTSNVLSGGGNDGTNTVPDAETFNVTIKDADGNTATDTIKVSIIDDVPTADPDTNAANSGATVTGNVESDDTFGADGKAGSGVVGVATGSNVGSPVSGGTGAGIVTSLGTLTLNADGTYSYQAKPNVSGVDHFVYTIKDGDGDLSTTTLDITVTKVAPSTDTESVTVNEAALDTTKDVGDLAASTITGSNSGSPDETKTGTLALGAGVTVIGGNDQTGAYGTLHVGSDGKFTYTLTSNVLSGPLNDGTNTVADADVFTVTIKDADGNTSTDTIKVSIIDDVPSADPDTNAVNSGATANGNVESDDTFGADGKAGSGVVGVATGSNTASPVSGGTGAGIVTGLGTLTLNADGTYTYAAKPNVSGVDHFVYTIADKDGDLSTTTLDITVTKVAPTTDTESVTVNEAALDTTKDAIDLAASTITGSNSGSPDETKTGTLALGAGVTVIGGNDQTGTYGTLHVGADGKFTYTLTSNVLSGPLNDGANTVPDADIFTVTIKDADGNTATDTIKVSIIDDVPTASADTKSVSAGGSTSANVESNDQFGADGKAGSGVVGVATGSNTASPVSGGTGAGIVTSLGTLTLNTNGTYNYQAKSNVSGIDHFVYTIKDGDGDLSTTTLDITVNNVVLKTETQTVTVYESALDKNKDPGDLVAGTVVGSDPTSTKETVTGTLTFDPGITTVTKDYTGTYGTLHVESTGAFTYTLSTNKIGSPAANDGANTYLAAESFGITIKDGGGNTGTDTIKVNVIDDTPLAFDPQDQSLLNSGLGGIITGALSLAGKSGADGLSSLVFSGAADGSKAMLADGTTPMTYQTHNILLTGFGTTQLTGTADINNNGKIDAGETAVFTVKLDSANDRYEFNLLKPIDNGAKIDFTDLSNAHAGNDVWLGVGADLGDPTTSRDLLYTSKTGGSVNSSSNDIATGNQWIEFGEGMRMDFVNGLVSGGGSYNFASHYQVQDYQVTLAQIKGGASTTTIKLSAFDVTTQANTNTTTAVDFGLETAVALAAGEVSVLRGGSAASGITITFASGVATIAGLQVGDVIQVDEATGFDRLMIESGSDKSADFAISSSKVLNTSIGFDLDTKFETTLTDGDGDTSKGQYIGINLQTDDGQSHTFTGGTGNDTIHGGSGHDTLSGGSGGSDLIFGDAGNDSMLYDSADKYDGGSGFDRLVVPTGGNSITYDNTKFIGIEMVDLGDTNDRSGAGNQNTLALSATDVVGANAGTVAGHQISFFVIGDTTGPTVNDRDNVHMTGFGAVIGSGSLVDPVTGVSHTYDVYQSTGNPAVKVAVEQGLDLV